MPEEEEPATVLWNSGRIDDVDLQNQRIEEDVEVKTEIENESSPATEAASDDVGIGIPDEELERHDPFASGAMYDSVRIMEPDVFLASTDRDGQTSPVGEKTAFRNIRRCFRRRIRPHNSGQHRRQRHRRQKIGKVDRFRKGTVLTIVTKFLKRRRWNGSHLSGSDNNLGGVYV